MNVFKQIVDNHGYLNRGIVDELNKLNFKNFKDMFEFVVKDFDGNRIFVTLNEFNEMEDCNIKEVFVPSEDYKVIEDMLNMKVLDTEELQCAYLAKQFEKYIYYSERDLIYYLNENMNVAKDLISEINSYNGRFDDLNPFENDEEFFEMFDLNGFQLACKIYYGDYKAYDEYVRFDVLGNLESLSDYQLEEEIRENLDIIVSETINNYENINIYDKNFKYMLDNHIKNFERGVI